MRLDLPGRTVVITGASGGLGAGLASALRAHRANVALLDLDADAVRQQADRLGGDRFARGWSIDVRDLEGLQQVMGEAAEHSGRIDVVVAGAGVLGTLETIDVTSAADWDRVIDLNLNGAWRTLKAAAPHVAASQVKGTWSRSRLGSPTCTPRCWPATPRARRAWPRCATS